MVIQHWSDTAGALLVGVLVCGCASERIPGTQDPGNSVRSVFAAQVINPQAALTAPANAPMHGGAAKASMDRYVRSFELPAPSANLFTIGVGAPPSTASPAASGAGSGASGAAGTAPRQ